VGIIDEGLLCLLTHPGDSRVHRGDYLSGSGVVQDLRRRDLDAALIVLASTHKLGIKLLLVRALLGLFLEALVLRLVLLSRRLSYQQHGLGSIAH